MVKGDLRIRVESPSGILAAGLASLLKDVGFATDTAANGSPSAVLIDVRLSAAFARAHGATPALALLSERMDPVIVLRLGYRGYLRSTDPPSDLLRALNAVRNGELWAERPVLQQLALEPRPRAPTPRERAVLFLLANGHSNGSIATQLEISVSTVKAHVTSLLDKYGVRSRLELAARVHSAG